MRGYIETFKDKDGDKNENKNNNLVSFVIDENKLSDKYKTISARTDDLQSFEFNALPGSDDRYIKAKIGIDRD